MERHLAHFNYARLAVPVDDPRVADFLKGRDPIRRIAETTPGFVWKQEAGAGEGTVEGDPRLLLSLSVWETPEALKHFTWNTLHKRFWMRRAEWFEPHEGPNMVLWWVEQGNLPTHAEAWERLQQRATEGDSDEAFGWEWLERSGEDSVRTLERVAAE